MAERHAAGLPQRVCVFRALQLGDLLCAVPAFRALRAALPNAQITLVGLRWASAYVQRFSKYIDHFIEFPGYPGLPESPFEARKTAEFLAVMQSHRFDLAIQLHGSGIITNPLVALFGARQLSGFFLSGQYCPNPHSFLEWDDGTNEVTRQLRLLEKLGIPAKGDEPEFPLHQDDFQALHLCPKLRHLLPTKYICLHPGKRDASRRWPAKHFARVADWATQRGYSVVVTGSAAELELSRAVRKEMIIPAIDACAADLPLGPFAALLSRAALVISNDTAAAHLAAALRVPSVVVFLRPDIDRWAPYASDLHRPIYQAGGAEPELVIRESETLLNRSVFSSDRSNACGL